MNWQRFVFRDLIAFFLAVLVLTTLASATPERKEKQVGRLLFGKVLDRQDNPVADAVVYLTNTRTRDVKSYIVGQDGTYRFPALSTAVDYEIYAQFKGKKSDTKSVSQFDDRPQVYLNLKIDAP
ncbi:MAG TPA: carboxypeptidase-like regulatory domain-containing protein [Candidatus Sulfotelmatobacter sp.]|nr:carboxypeptidase-like regulatory domain-containing protein [Candidatus Sulfotelmatobacter sp.]